MSFDAQNSNLSYEKAALRKQMRRTRKAISPEARKVAEDAVAERLFNLPAIKKAKTIGVYQAMGSELSVTDLVKALRLTGDVRIAYPAVISDSLMVFARVERGEMPEFLANPLAQMEISELGDRVIDANDINVLLIPGVAFDEKCRRLGQGGGYYDRFLPHKADDCLAIGIAFDEQIVDELPCGAHDRRMSYVVTPTRIIMP